MTEFAPKGSSPKMTRAQVKAYIKNMKKAQAIAQAKLNAANNSGEIEIENLELKILEKKLEEL